MDKSVPLPRINVQDILGRIHQSDRVATAQASRDEQGRLPIHLQYPASNVIYSIRQLTSTSRPSLPRAAAFRLNPLCALTGPAGELQKSIAAALMAWPETMVREPASSCTRVTSMPPFPRKRFSRYRDYPSLLFSRWLTFFLNTIVFRSGGGIFNSAGISNALLMVALWRCV